MDFRTELSAQPSQWKFGLRDSLLTLGSCFAQSVGQRLTENKFPTMANPFGTTYHPFSIHKLLRYTSLYEYPKEHTYLVNHGISYNYDFHSSLADQDRTILQKQIEERITSAHDHLKGCSVVLLTYGTAWIYERLDTHAAVANCHKMPGSMFARRLVSDQEIVESFDSVVKSIESFNPNIQFILTVSPVRHLNDTLSLNSVSKSVLRLACHKLSEKHQHVHYFPAYEMMMDDLRDYRFYEKDLIHPTEFALEYIWSKFSNHYFDQATLAFLKSWVEVKKALLHRSFHPDSAAHKKFIHEAVGRLEELKSLVNVEKEINQLKSQLAS